MSHDDEMFVQRILRSSILVVVLSLTGVGTYEILFSCILGTTTTKVAPIKPEASSDADKTTRQLINQQIHMRRLFVYILVTMNIKKY